jgi:uncharacterized protein
MRALSRAVYLLALSSTLGTASLAQSPPREPLPLPQSRPYQEPARRTLRVEGTGEVRAAADEAFIDLAVETSAPTARQAAEQNAQRLQRVLAALERAGVPREELETRSYTVYPVYEAPEPQQPPELRGYRVSNTVVVHVTELGRVGELVDVALEAGSNRVDAVRFGLRQSERVEAEALRRAVARARQSAQVLAEALGVTLGPVLEASTVAEPPPFFPVARLEAADRGGATTPILPGEQVVQARVVLVYSLEPAPRGRP